MRTNTIECWARSLFGDHRHCNLALKDTKISHFKLQLVGYTCINENISEQKRWSFSPSSDQSDSLHRRPTLPRRVSTVVVFFEIVSRRIYCWCRARLKCWKFLFIHCDDCASLAISQRWCENKLNGIDRRIHLSLMQFDFASMDALMRGGMKSRREIDEMMRSLLLRWLNETLDDDGKNEQTRKGCQIRKPER